MLLSVISHECMVREGPRSTLLGTLVLHLFGDLSPNLGRARGLADFGDFPPVCGGLLCLSTLYQDPHALGTPPFVIMVPLLAAKFVNFLMQDRERAITSPRCLAVCLIVRVPVIVRLWMRHCWPDQFRRFSLALVKLSNSRKQPSGIRRIIIQHNALQLPPHKGK